MSTRRIYTRSAVRRATARRWLDYEMNPEKCRGCTACTRVCPAGAISGTPRYAHTIDVSKCLKCGACMEKCKFNAISRK